MENFQVLSDSTHTEAGITFREVWLTRPEIGIEVCYRHHGWIFQPHGYTIKGLDDSFTEINGRGGAAGVWDESLELLKDFLGSGGEEKKR